MRPKGNPVNVKTVVVIPSRYGSTRFDGKPLVAIAGKPMIQWVYERAQQAGHITDVVVATDDDRIVEAVSAFGGQVVLTSDRCRSGTDRVAETADIMQLEDTDIVVNLQGDQPLINPECLNQVVAPFRNDKTVKMSTLAFRIAERREITDPKDVKVTFDNNFDALYFSRSPIPCGRDGDENFGSYKHLGVYAYTKGFLNLFAKLPAGRLENIEKLEQLRAMEHGHRIRVVITDHDSPEVDLPIDISRIERRLASQ